MERLRNLIDRIEENKLKTSLRRSTKYGDSLLWLNIYNNEYNFKEGSLYEINLAVRNPSKSGYVNFCIRSWDEWLPQSKYDFLNL